MAREIRLDGSGYYHVSNRGVGLREVFSSNEDRIFFITLLCKSAKQYHFAIQSYALVSNGYNILIKTTKNNLSHIMKTINGQYTSYFNRRHRRKGHLWEGRFKSWHIEDISFVLEILSYIEHLPIYAGDATEKQNYPYASYRQFIGIDERLSCLNESIVFQKFNNLLDIKDFFNKPIDVDRIHRIHRLLRQQSRARVERPSKKALPFLDPSYFESSTKAERNQKIYEAYQKGYSQAKIGAALYISQQAVYKIIKKLSSS